LRNLHFEKGDFVLLNHSTLYDTEQLPFTDRIVQILTKVTGINEKTINFELIDKAVSYHSLSESVEEIVNITEAIAKSVAKNVAEQMNITEVVAKSVAKSLTDGISLAETISKYIGKAATEGVTVSEQAWKNAFLYDGAYDYDGTIKYGEDYGVL